MSFNVIDLSMCFVYKIRLESLSCLCQSLNWRVALRKQGLNEKTAASVLLKLFISGNTQVINVLNGIWRHHLLSNKVGQNSCPLILENNHSMFSIICVRFMYKYFLPFLIRRRLSFFKDISCFIFNFLSIWRTAALMQ